MSLNLEKWMEQASCKGSPNASWWFPERGEPQGEAIAVCRRCPVRRECLDYALERNETEGIWGGLTPHERQKIRRARRAA